MEIEQVSQASEEVFKAFQKLIPQLTSNNPPPTREELEILVGSKSSILLIARNSDTKRQIIGSGCLTIYRVPTGIRAIIEDVIVDESVRGMGIGKALVLHLLEIAKAKGAKGVSLTSNPKRISANRLYQHIGFIRRETNAYVFIF